MILQSSRVWLTGASSGIGAALVDALVAEGARVAVTARRADALEELAARHRARGADVLVLPADVADRAAVHAAARGVETTWGGIDLALFNAGFGRRLQVTNFNAEDFAEIFRVNLFGVMYGIEAVLPAMLQRRGGRVAAVASLAGYRGAPTLAGYGSSKAALIHALDSLRFDLEPHGIGVTVITPGYVRTPMTAQHTYWMPALMDADKAAGVIVRGLRHDRKEIHFPARFSWTLKALRLLPFPIYERLVRAAVRRGAR
ncbi:MAG: SDR family NAD(P)-dependent oxidoreductase [Acidobacteria bacterium]|nr:MAG: SDR family NAD(P)-dependent oxidoreductase [Acidobacteriota bacterium]